MKGPNIPETGRSTSFTLHDAVKSERDFAIFDLNLGDIEKAALAKLKIDDGLVYDNFGTLAFLATDTVRYLESIGNSNEDATAASKVIARISDSLLDAFAAETAWIAFRSFPRTTAFDTPRWHQDGYYYQPYEDLQKKAAVALIGHGTLFKETPPETRRAFTRLSRSLKHDDPDRQEKLSRLVEANPSIFPSQNQGAIFAAGSDEGAIHSEPPVSSTRLFMSAVPGSREQIEELRHSWGRKSRTYDP